MFGLDPRKAWAVGALAAVLYLLITGMQPSVLRATVMVVIYAFGHILARRPDVLNVLGASALISLLIDPSDVAELGFQLSYLSVIGIFVFAPMLKARKPLRPSERAVRGWGGRSRDWVGGSLRVSLGVGLCTWPLLVATVHVFSPVMLLSNILSAPVVGVMLVLGLFVPLALIPGVGAALAWLLSTLAGLLDGLAGLFASVPYGHLFPPAPPIWWLAGYYVLLACVVLAPRLGLPRVSGAVAWLVWLCVLPATTLLGGEAPGPARLTALDVGQGQCVVLEVPGGPCAVLDCGSTSLGAVGERVLAPYLWNRRRTVIDMLFVSHADADHVNGLPQLFERFPVGTVYISETFGDDDAGAALTKWLSDRAEVRVLRRGDEIELAPELNLRCLWPDVEFVRALMTRQQQRNDGGLVLQLQAGPTRVLLPSDVETRGLAGALPLAGAGRQARTTVLFAPHQGSAVAGLPEILSLLQPVHVVISARESFPAEESLAAYDASGANVWKTWQHGAVTFMLAADGGIAATPFID
jgi:competence protein ComEC